METSTIQLKKSGVFLCLECGKCTAVCPISRFNQSYSPRRLVTNGVLYGADNLAEDSLLWSCLTCRLCSQRCPVDVDYSGYMRDARAAATTIGARGAATHSGALHYIMEMAACPDIKQDRTRWIDSTLKVAKTSEVMYFVGCLPYHEGLFAKDFDFTPNSIAVDTVRILNHLGIEPVVLDNERCCGHDLYWLGKLDKFDELARANMAAIKEAGVKEIITACPECALTFAELYAERIGGKPPKVKHIAQVIAENVDKLHLQEKKLTVAFQDPCRLGRFLGVYDEPRAALRAIPGLELREMAHSRKGAVCCGTTNWVNCNATSKQIQQSRLDEARAAGAQMLVTACPKCQIHFRCAQQGQDGSPEKLELTDLVNIVASAIGNGDS
jgi:Fe-S oxidoreductase